MDSTFFFLIGWMYTRQYPVEDSDGDVAGGACFTSAVPAYMGGGG